MGYDIIEGVTTRTDWIRHMITNEIVGKRIVNGTAYLALRDGDTVYGTVVIFSKNKYRLAGKIMDEAMHPYNYDCPEKIFNLLTPTTDRFSMAWREKVRERLAKN